MTGQVKSAVGRGACAHPSVGAKSVSELVAIAKAKPGYFNFGTLGTGSTSHLGAELLKMRAGIEFQQAAYKGGAPAAAAVVACTLAARR